MNPIGYRLDVDKVTEWSNQRILNDEELLRGRSYFKLVVAPVILLIGKKEWYLTTKNMEPVQAAKDYTFTEENAAVAIPVHVIFVDEEGQLKFDQKPSFNFATTVKEIIEGYSEPVYVWTEYFEKEMAAKWVGFMLNREIGK